MEFNNRNNMDNPQMADPGYAQARSMDQDATLRAFMSNVFSLMFMALGVTAIVSYIFGNSMYLMSFLFNLETGGPSILGYIVMFAPIGMVLLFNVGMRKWSPAFLLGFFILFAAVFGASISYIFLIYDIGSILSTFVVTSLTFGAMALLGYTTKTDLTKMGRILYMALIGIIIATVVNFLIIRSGMFDYLISIVGVIIFTGLTAYDVQKLKRIGMGVEYGTATTAKLAIWGALDLYLDFINLFLLLLRLFGDRD